MSEHKISLIWERESEDFTYKTYNREHTVRFKNEKSIDLSAATGFLGKEEFVDPEEMFVASYSSCHMLTFLAMAAKYKYVVDSYEDSAVGYLEKNTDGKLAITRIELSPVVVFGGDAPNEEELTRLHDRAHAECFIANSTKVLGSVKPATVNS